jgi:hypothetical protein
VLLIDALLADAVLVGGLWAVVTGPGGGAPL